MRLLFLAVICAAIGCDGVVRTPRGESGNGGAGGDDSSSSSSTSSASSSSGEPPCKVGGDQCAGFAECCSGSCAAGVCEACNATGDMCGNGEGCCVGLTCYNGKCGQCTDDYLDCTLAADCCSGICTQGKCEPIDCMGLMNCVGQCVDTSSDTMHCGGCGVECSATTQCCGGGCSDTKTDEANCGACGNACPPNNSCAQGQCAANPLCCADGVNVGEPLQPSPNVGNWIYNAIKWVAACDMVLTRIEMYTDQGYLGIASDNAGAPGPILFQDSFPKSNPPMAKWAGVNVQPAIKLVAGTTYWVWQSNSVTQFLVLSEAKSGVFPIVKGAQNWAGPWLDSPPLHYTMKVIGNCVP